MFSGRAPDPGLRGSIEHQAARGHRVRARRHHHQHIAHRSGRDTPRRLPGLRAPHDFLPAFTRASGTLRERLPAHQCHPDGKRREAGWRCGLACLGGGVGSALWVDRVRSHQRLFRGYGSHRRGLGPRFRRRIAAARRDPGRRGSSVVGDRPRRAGRRAESRAEGSPKTSCRTKRLPRAVSRRPPTSRTR